MPGSKTCLIGAFRSQICASTEEFVVNLAGYFAFLLRRKYRGRDKIGLLEKFAFMRLFTSDLTSPRSFIDCKSAATWLIE